jgi:hypothetical protein
VPPKNKTKQKSFSEKPNKVEDPLVKQMKDKKLLRMGKENTTADRTMNSNI